MHFEEVLIKSENFQILRPHAKSETSLKFFQYWDIVFTSSITFCAIPAVIKKEDTNGSIFWMTVLCTWSEELPNPGPVGSNLFGMGKNATVYCPGP